MPLDIKEFENQFQALCEAHEVREFAIYGRYAQEVDTQGRLCPPARLIWLLGEKMVAEEAEYHFGRIAEGKKP